MDLKHVILLAILSLLLREKDSISKASEVLNARDPLTDYDPIRELGVVDPGLGGIIRRDEEKMLLQNASLLQNAKGTTILPTNEITVYYERNESRNEPNNDTNKLIRSVDFQQRDDGDKKPNCKTTLTLASATAARIYIITCPGLDSLNMVEPCPRENWQTLNVKPSNIQKDDDGTPTKYHYWYVDKKIDTLYDYDPKYQNVRRAVSRVLRRETWRQRAHTCSDAYPVTNLQAITHGLGWIYFIWRQPMENCFAMPIYKWQYDTDNGSFTQDYAGTQKLEGAQYQFHKFHPCPEYPNWICFIMSENIIPYLDVNFKVSYVRFGADRSSDLDRSTWVNITTATDDQIPLILFCPPDSIWNKLWFLILLIILFLLLLLVACVLIGLLYKRKRKAEREEDQEYEEEKIPPTNIFEKTWERLKNFFAEMCPRPKKPPPPPPPPPPKPKRKKKRKPKKKKKKKKPKPVEPPPKSKNKESPSPPPPPPKPRKKKRIPRGGRSEKPDTQRAVMDTKRAASGVGGTGRRRR